MFPVNLQVDFTNHPAITGLSVDLSDEVPFKNTLKKPMLVRAGLVRPGDTSPVARKQEVQKAIRYILRNAKRHEDKKVNNDG